MKADPNLERSVTVHQGIEKTLALYPSVLYNKLYSERKKASTVETTFDKFSTKK